MLERGVQWSVRCSLQHALRSPHHWSVDLRCGWLCLLVLLPVAMLVSGSSAAVMQTTPVVITGGPSA
jgi:hypothetical protein